MTNKTLPTPNDAGAFLAAVPDPQRRADAQALAQLMQQITGQPPVMWGESIVGFGSHHYKYDSGREGDEPAVAFAPRKQALVLYSVIYYEQNQDLAAHLGPHTTGKGCLYIKKLSDIDLNVLTEMIKRAYERKS